jgi:GNAT superfamily N-acetyltransferase
MSFHDLSQIKYLSLQLGYPVEVSDLSKRFERLEVNPDHALFVFEQQEKVLSFMHLMIDHDLIEALKVEVKVLVVDEKARSLGIGKKMMDQAEAWAKEKGVSGVFLSSQTKRPDAHRFYERCGYSIKKSSHFFEKSFLSKIPKVFST